MAFDQYGRFIPNTTATPMQATSAMQPASARAAATAPTAVQPAPLPQSSTANPQLQAGQASRMATAPALSAVRANSMQQIGPQQTQQYNAPDSGDRIPFNPPTTAPNMPPTAAQIAAQQNQSVGAMPMQRMPMPQFMSQQQFMPGQFMPPRSLEQQVQNNNPQSVQNFLSALNQVGAGGNNNFMNAYGQQGAGPQAGFQGFGQNGMPVQLGYAAPQGYTGPVGPGLQFQGNMAQGNANFNMGNAAYQGQNWMGPNPWTAGGGNVISGGTGGLQGAPQWQTPGPWTNPGNDWNNLTTDQQYNVLFGKYDPSIHVTPKEQGGFYSQKGADGTDLTGTSDIRSKTEIKSADSELEEFLDALGVYSYEYKDPQAHGEGRRISPMAQELEKTPLGQQFVRHDAQGVKMVDYGKMAGTQLAATALLNHKYKELEAKLSKAIKEKFNGRK